MAQSHLATEGQLVAASTFAVHHLKLGRNGEAAHAFAKARDCPVNAAERALLMLKLEACQ